jgi:hypothetical protein
MTKAISPAKPTNIKKRKDSSTETQTIQRNSRQKFPPVPLVQLSKQDMVIAMIKQAKGATITELMTATGWQAHSVRGVISAVLKKRLNLNVISELSAKGHRRYRITEIESV